MPGLFPGRAVSGRGMVLTTKRHLERKLRKSRDTIHYAVHRDSMPLSCWQTASERVCACLLFMRQFCILEHVVDLQVSWRRSACLPSTFFFPQLCVFSKQDRGEAARPLSSNSLLPHRSVWFPAVCSFGHADFRRVCYSFIMLHILCLY
jgi:hypothetical protein